MIRSRSFAQMGDDLHRSYRSRDGSGFIASGFAMGGIAQLVARRQPRSILEVGAGVGALTAAVLEGRRHLRHPSTHVAVEDVPFCLRHLEANLGDDFARLVVVPYCRDAPPNLDPFDFVVIDGGAVTDLLPEEQHRWSPDDEHAEVTAWMDRLAPGATVIVENVRSRQRSFIEADAAARGRRFSHEHIRPRDGTPGFHLYLFDPGPWSVLRSRVANACRSLWFPRGMRAEKRLYRKLTGRTRPPRDTVATSDGPGGSDIRTS